MCEFLAPDLVLVVYIHIQADPPVTSPPCMIMTVCLSLSSTSLEASCQKLQVELEKAPKQQDIERYVFSPMNYTVLSTYTATYCQQ